LNHPKRGGFLKYRRYRSDTVAAGVSSPDRIKGRQVPAGHTLEVTYFAGGIRAEENRLVELGYIRATGEDMVLKAKIPDTQESQQIDGTVWLEEYEIPYVELTNLDSGSKYFLSVHGKLWPIEVWSRENAEVQQEPNLSDK